MALPAHLRAGLGGALVLAVIVGLGLVGGLFGESAEDRVNAVAATFSGTVSHEALDAALAHVDPSVAPVEVDARLYGGDFTRVYGNGATADLRRDARRALAPVMGESFSELRRGVTVADDERNATASIQLLSTSRGTATVNLALVADGERWLVRRIEVTR